MKKPITPPQVDYASPVARPRRTVSMDRLVLGLFAATCLILLGLGALIGVWITWINRSDATINWGNWVVGIAIMITGSTFVGAGAIEIVAVVRSLLGKPPTKRWYRW